jgi:hypothetical protein
MSKNPANFLNSCLVSIKNCPPSRIFREGNLVSPSCSIHDSTCYYFTLEPYTKSCPQADTPNVEYLVNVEI